MNSKWVLSYVSKAVYVVWCVSTLNNLTHTNYSSYTIDTHPPIDTLSHTHTKPQTHTHTHTPEKSQRKKTGGGKPVDVSQVRKAQKGKPAEENRLRIAFGGKSARKPA